jgi:hypothetical protein
MKLYSFIVLLFGTINILRDQNCSHGLVCAPLTEGYPQTCLFATVLILDPIDTTGIYAPKDIFRVLAGENVPVPF